MFDIQKHPFVWGFLLFILIVFLLWVYTGGPKKADPETGAFMKPLAPLDSGKTYNETVYPVK